MAVGEYLLPRYLLSILRPPALRITEKERPVVVGPFSAKGIVCGRETCDIGDVLAERELSVLVEVGKRHVRVVLGHQLGGRRLEVRQVLRCPPVPQTAGGVELAPLIVEAVADFVSDDRADRAIARR